MRRILFFLLFITTSLEAQEKPYYYSVKTNLFDHKITAIEQDQHGRLILGTDKGLFSYNGFQSKQIPTQNLYTKEISSLVKVGSKLIGITKSGQLFELKNNQVSVFATPEVKSPVVRIEVRNEKELFVVCAHAVFVYQMSPFSFVRKYEVPFYEKGSAELIDIEETASGLVGLLSSNELVAFSEQLAMTIPSIKGTNLVKQGDHVLVFPSRPTAYPVFAFQNKRFKNRFRIARGINHEIHQVVALKNSLALLSGTGLMLVNAESLKLKSVLVGFNVTAVFQDANHTTWIGTASKGLICIPSGSFKLLNTTEFRRLELGADRKMVYAENTLGTTLILHPDGQVKKQATLEETTNQVSYFKTKYHFPFSVGDEVIKKIVPLKDNQFLVASSKGVYSFEAKNDKEFKAKLFQATQRRVVVEDPVKDCQVSPEGELLFSSVDGLHVVNAHNLEHRTITFFNESIDATQLLFHDQKWVVLTSNSRVFVIQDGKVIQDVNFKDNGNNILVSKLKISDNFFYILSDKALYRTVSITGKLERLNELSSLTDILIRDFVVQGDHVYLATQIGLFRFEWKNAATQFPVLLIGTPEGDFKSGEKAVFEPQNTRISIPYEMVDLMGNHPYSIQYRLIRNDKSEGETWKTASFNVSALNFEHLRAGTYCLEVRMVDPGTRSVSKTLNTFFEVEASWYEDIIVWFMAGIILGFLFFWYLRGRRRLRKLRRLMK